LVESVPRRRSIRSEGEARLMGRKGGIEVENLVREFRKGPRAVDGISLRVEPGEVYGFLGPNGAGKSTTVLMLTTLLPPTSGTAHVAGYDIVEEGPRVRASIGAALVTIIALIAGIPISGGFDFFGLIGLAVLVNVAATLFGAGWRF
jgi:ABC-type Na+ transport system ATPase subunit NatA